MSFLRPRRVLPLPRLRPRLAAEALHATASPTHAPNPPLELDPALQALLKDTDISILRSKSRHRGPEADEDSPLYRPPHRELEVLEADSDAAESAGVEESAREEMEKGLFPPSERKSPAASFGSRAIGAVILPFELQSSILRLISESDKPLIHAHAARLFQEQNDAEDAWSTRYTPPAYTTPRSTSPHTHINARINRQRDGTAFASVVMPAQYAVVAAVLTGVKTRLGVAWARSVGRIVEWGSGTGAGMWAALYAFRQPSEDGDAALTLAGSNIVTYTGIEKREGLAVIARRLLRDISTGSISISLQKTLHYSDRVPGRGSIALSAFALSTLGNAGLRRQMVREMWDSGAEVIVVIDDASSEGFRHVADARTQLLRLGQRNDAPGAHVLAPCPHDRACPLALRHFSSTTSASASVSASTVRCTFSQRLQRPAFVRKTKHAGHGEEDVGYAYVVVRRGARPVSEGMHEGVREGRVGAVARWADEAGRAKEGREAEARARAVRWEGDVEKLEGEAAAARSEVEPVEAIPEAEAPQGDALDGTLQDEALEDALRAEAYAWPRINFPPLKRSGHILIDACMPEGNIMRMTFPRSQGKQVYYDARKSAWGDLFPHAPKHRPVLRYTGSKAKPTPEDPADRELVHALGLQDVDDAPAGKKEKGRGRGRGGEGDLRKVRAGSDARAGWAGVMDGLKEEGRQRRQERRRERGAKELDVV